jgi:hypothetical protein
MQAASMPLWYGRPFSVQLTITVSGISLLTDNSSTHLELLERHTSYGSTVWMPLHKKKTAVNFGHADDRTTHDSALWSLEVASLYALAL